MCKYGLIFEIIPLIFQIIFNYICYMRKLITSSLLLLSITASFAQSKSPITVALYNCENFFDTKDDPNKNDDNEMDTFPSEQNDETMYFEDGQQGDDQLNIPPILFNDTNKAKTSNNNVTVRHPPTIVTKPKAIRPIRSAATRIMAKNRVE